MRLAFCIPTVLVMQRAKNTCPELAWAQRMVERLMERMVKDQLVKCGGRGARALGAEGIRAAEPPWVGRLGQGAEGNPAHTERRAPAGFCIFPAGWRAAQRCPRVPSASVPASQHQPSDTGEPLGAGLRRRPLALLPADRLALFACLLRCLCQQNAPNTRIAAVISALSLLKLLLSPD